MRTSALGKATAVVVACVVSAAVALAAAPPAEQVIRETGATAGLAVVVGTTDGALEAELAQGGKMLVHGLALSDESATKARKHLLDRQLHGRASVLPIAATTRLPYADNLVNLLVVTGVPLAAKEALRVLAPNGVALFLDRPQGAAERKLVKQWPTAFDEWSHPDHGPNGNPVSHDRAAGPPRHVQWVAGPLWGRTHDSYPSVSAMVSAGGRIFYVLDEGPAGVIDERFPDRWALYARDAFNGVLLWRVPLRDWFHVVYKTTDIRRIEGPWRQNRKERLVAQRDLVFVKPGARGPRIATRRWSRVWRSGARIGT